MRALVVYTLAILVGAIGYSFSTRAERWVGQGAKTGGAAVASDVTALRLEIYALGKATPVRVVTVNATRLDIGDQNTAMTEDAWRAVQAAVRLPAGLERRAQPAPPKDGGDLLVIERGAAVTWVLGSGWEAGPLDAVKAAVWSAVRARWSPARKHRPTTEFVEPFEALRKELRIRF